MVISFPALITLALYVEAPNACCSLPCAVTAVSKVDACNIYSTATRAKSCICCVTVFSLLDDEGEVLAGAPEAVVEAVGVAEGDGSAVVGAARTMPLLVMAFGD